jgi:predicted nucleic acid-binding protein
MDQRRRFRVPGTAQKGVAIAIVHDRLLDSVILIDHFNGIMQATNYLQLLVPDKTAISVITRAEILVGFEAGTEEVALRLLDEFALYPIDRVIADRAAELRRTYGWKLPDAFQAAIALQHNLRLITRNTKDFDPKRHPFVDVPYVL